MSKSERRKIFCSVLFHLIAIVCILWSVYILVRRTAEEIRLGKNGQCFPFASPPLTRQSQAACSTVPVVSPSLFACQHVCP